MNLVMAKQTAEHIKKKSLARRRGQSFNCEVCTHQFWRKPCEIKKGNNRFCSKKCYFQYQIGRKKDLSNRRKLIGDKNHNWKGGITSENKKMRHSADYRIWRESVFKRDNWICQSCGKRSKSNEYLRIEAHHIKPFAAFPELRLSIDNGETLCKKCHDKKPKGKEIYIIKQ